MGYSAEDIFIERERRVELQKKLMDRFNNPLLFIKVNYPGVKKNNNISNSIMQNMDMLISDIFSSKIQIRLFRTSAEGPNVIMILNDSPIEIKKITVQIEEKHILGQCIDIDVFDNKNGKSINRLELGVGPKRCLICEDIALNCLISSRHKNEDITNFIHEKYKEFMESFYGKIV